MNGKPLDMPAATWTAYTSLRQTLASYPSLMIAYSGGVDSGLLAYVAYEVLGENAVPVMGISPSFAGREERAAIAFLETHGIPYETLDTYEMNKQGYVENSPSRCYFCKSELFEKMSRLAHDRGIDHMAYGANLDDQGDHRPGAVAARENEIVAPLIDAGLNKAMIRELSRALGLELWDKPAAPCLASRIPYFQPVTTDKLSQVEAGENLLKDLGFAVCRLRHHGEVARVEIPQEQHETILEPSVWEQVQRGLKTAGFDRVELEPEGFRSGRLNDGLMRREAH